MSPLILYTGHATSGHLHGVTKMLELGGCTKREIKDFMLPSHNDKP